MSRAKIEEVTLNALRTRQSLVKGERLVRHEMRAVLFFVSSTKRSPQFAILYEGGGGGVGVSMGMLVSARHARN